MNSRTDILANIKANKPEAVDLPDIQMDLFDESLNLQSHFKKMVEAVGGNVLTADSNSELLNEVHRLYPDAKHRFTTLENIDSFNTMPLNQINDPHQIEELDLLILKGTFGIAENGAIWLTDEQFPIRVSPFICKHLVLVLDASKIYLHLHQAYNIMEGSDFDFGIFISGPSKTADIEQSLVIGAHGALSLTVFLT